MSTYVSVDIHENVWLSCDEHPQFEKILDEGSSMAGIAAIVEAHNEHVEQSGCGTRLKFELKEPPPPDPPELHPPLEEKLRNYYDGRGIG